MDTFELVRTFSTSSFLPHCFFFSFVFIAPHRKCNKNERRKTKDEKEKEKKRKLHALCARARSVYRLDPDLQFYEHQERPSVRHDFDLTYVCVHLAALRRLPAMTAHVKQQPTANKIQQIRIPMPTITFRSQFFFFWSHTTQWTASTCSHTNRTTLLPAKHTKHTQTDRQTS